MGTAAAAASAPAKKRRRFIEILPDDFFYSIEKRARGAIPDAPHASRISASRAVSITAWSAPTLAVYLPKLRMYPAMSTASLLGRPKFIFAWEAHQVGHKEALIACELSRDDLKWRGVSSALPTIGSPFVWRHAFKGSPNCPPITP